MPEAEINILDAVNKVDARPEEASFSLKAQERDVRNRMDILFGKDQEGKKQL